MILYYLSLAWRNICRQKIQSLLSIVGLAVALFCFGIFSYLVYSFVFTDNGMRNGRLVCLLNVANRYDM